MNKNTLNKIRLAVVVIAFNAGMMSPNARTVDQLDAELAELEKELAQAQFFNAILDENVDAVVAGIKQGVDVNKPCPQSGLPALRMALEIPYKQKRPINIEIIRHLVKAGARAEPQVANKVSPLSLVFLNPHESAEATALLLEAGANPYSMVSEKANMMEAACLAGKLAILATLLSSPQAKLNDRPISQGNDQISLLSFAVAGDLLPCAQTLIDAGADVRLRTKRGKTLLELAQSPAMRKLVDNALREHQPQTKPHRFGLDVIEVALAQDNVKLLEKLFDDGLSVDFMVKGYPLLVAAVDCEAKKCVQFLLDHGADPGVRFKEGKTPLMMASWTKSGFDLAQMLLDAGARVDDEDIRGRTALTYLLDQGCSIDFFKLLVRRGANLTHADDVGQRPIHNLANSGCMNTTPGISEWVTHLLDAGADVSSAGYAGWTPLVQAVMRGSHAIMHVLIDAKANVHAQDELGWTALHHAALNNDNRAIEILVAAGAQVDLKSYFGDTPISVAKTSQAIGLLLRYGASESNMRVLDRLSLVTNRVLQYAWSWVTPKTAALAAGVTWAAYAIPRYVKKLYDGVCKKISQLRSLMKQPLLPKGDKKSNSNQKQNRDDASDDWSSYVYDSQNSLRGTRVIVPRSNPQREVDELAKSRVDELLRKLKPTEQKVNDVGTIHHPRTKEFNKWIGKLNGVEVKRVKQAMADVEEGRTANTNQLGDRLQEYKFRDGTRLYFVMNQRTVTWLRGGDKSSQDGDIAWAKLQLKRL